LPTVVAPTIITTDELRALLDVPNTSNPTGLRNRAIIAAMGFGGLRVGEVTRLTLQDIYLGVGAMRLALRNPGGDVDRQVTVAGDGAAILGDWLAGRAALEIPGGHVFCTVDRGGRRGPGQPTRKQYIQEMVPRLGRRAGINQHLTCTTLRTTAAALRLAGGDSHAEVAEFLGLHDPRYARLFVWGVARLVEGAKWTLHPDGDGRWVLHPDE